METKACTKCKVVKNLSEYYKGSFNKSGYAPSCKECMIAKSKNYNSKQLDINSDSFKEKRKEIRSKSYYKDIEKTRTYCREKAKQYREDNLELCRARGRKAEQNFRDQNPELSILRAAKRRAKQLNLNFNLEKEDINIPDLCPVLNIPILKGIKFPTDNSPSLDRIDNSVGYIKGNVMVISHRANMIKSMGTAEEHEAIAAYIKANLVLNQTLNT